MKCYKCGKGMVYHTRLRFKEYTLRGWNCVCGEMYFDSDDAQRTLLLNKIKKKVFKSKLGRIRSNLIIRIPKEIEVALGLRQGEEVTLKIKGNELVLTPL